MGFLKNLFTETEIEPRLIGVWFSDLNDEHTVREFGDVKMLFEKNGKLTYEIEESGKKQYIFLTFSTKDNIITTDQPSSSRKEQTEFNFHGDNVLILKFDGIESRYVKTR